MVEENRLLEASRRGVERRVSVRRHAGDLTRTTNGVVEVYLRRTFATRLYRDTGKIRLVQKVLGHSDLSTTMIYTHVVDEELEGAMKGL